MYAGDEDFVLFQRDKASCHKAKYTKEWFMEQSPTVLDWLAKSSDLKIIENVWSVLAPAVCVNSKQFDTVEDFKERFIYE